MNPEFDLTSHQRSQLLENLIDQLEHYYSETASFRVAPVLNVNTIREALRRNDLQQPVGMQEAMDGVLRRMEQDGVHTPHPMYYGLYNPRAAFAGILADLITAVYNPQLAAWSHSPFANEVEKYLIETFGGMFGYEPGTLDGVFASGGAEANFTAMLCALNHAFPELAKEGLQGIPVKPIIYCSAETHHSIMKSARMAGLGSESVRLISVDENLQMEPEDLERQILQDLEVGHKPIMVVATAGTTGTGVIDPLEQVGKVCRQQGIWYHVDGAYGGAAVVDEASRAWLKGIELSDSLIVDLHKWFSLPMACSMFITKDRHILSNTFGINTGYMPRDAAKLHITDGFTHSFQWSRRFIGLKLYLSLLMYGMSGYAQVIRHQIEMGERLRQLLKDHGWIVVNQTPLPVVCFTHPEGKEHPEYAPTLCQHIVSEGKAWISVYPVNGSQVLRSCITNYNTEEKHLVKLVELLEEARKKPDLKPI